MTHKQLEMEIKEKIIVLKLRQINYLTTINNNDPYIFCTSYMLYMLCYMAYMWENIVCNFHNALFEFEFFDLGQGEVGVSNVSMSTTLLSIDQQYFTGNWYTLY